MTGEGGRPTIPAAAARAQEALDGLRRARSLAIDLGKSLSGIRPAADPEMAAEIGCAQFVLVDLIAVVNEWLARIADETGEEEKPC